MLKKILNVVLPLCLIGGTSANAVSLTTELECLATNAYFESKNQSLAGQIAVTLVVLNRVNNEKFPNTACKVILEGPVKESWKTRLQPTLAKQERIYYPVKNRCQFSWYCDGKKDIIKEPTTYKIIKERIKFFLKTDIYDFTNGATYYHATYISPDWAREKTITTIIEDHIFYR